jgi:Phage tail tube protein, GTA-gp10
MTVRTSPIRKTKPMPNRRRGEVALQLGDTRYTLCLTLGALAELEDAFGVQDLMALTERFGTGRLSSRDLLTLLGVALRGGGQPLSDAEVASLPLHEGIEPVAAALADLLVMTFGGGEGSPNPPTSQETSASHAPSPGTTR